MGDCILRKAILTIVLAGLSVLITFGNTLTGEIRGGVLDLETKLVLPKVAVRLASVDRGWKRPAPAGLCGAKGSFARVKVLKSFKAIMVF